MGQKRFLFVSEAPDGGSLPDDPLEPHRSRGRPGRPGGRAALEELVPRLLVPAVRLCSPPRSSSPEAEDLVQGFLADLLERGDLASVDRSKGRFRSFLRAACEHYLANRRDHDRAAKRGGGVTIVPIDRLDAESRYDREPAHELTAERLFERQWALTLLGRVLERLEAEMGQAGKARLFARLRPALTGGRPGPFVRARSATSWG